MANNDEAVRAIMKVAQKAGVKAGGRAQQYAEKVVSVRSQVSALRDTVAKIAAETQVYPREQSALVKARQSLELAVQQLDEAERKLQQQAKFDQVR